MNEKEQQFIDSAQTGDVILTESTGVLGALIKIKTGSDYTHAAFVYRVHDSRLGIKIPFIIEAVGKGVIMRPLIGYFGNNHYKSLTLLRPHFITEAQRFQMVNTALSYIGRSYDSGQLVAILLNNGYDNDDSLICSQLIDMIYKNAGIQVKKEHSCATPATIGTDPNFEIVKTIKKG